MRAKGRSLVFLFTEHSLAPHAHARRPGPSILLSGSIPSRPHHWGRPCRGSECCPDWKKEPEPQFFPLPARSPERVLQKVTEPWEPDSFRGRAASLSPLGIIQNEKEDRSGFSSCHSFGDIEPKCELHRVLPGGLVQGPSWPVGTPLRELEKMCPLPPAKCRPARGHRLRGQNSATKQEATTGVISRSIFPLTQDFDGGTRFYFFF